MKDSEGNHLYGRVILRMQEEHKGILGYLSIQKEPNPGDREIGVAKEGRIKS